MIRNRNNTFTNINVNKNQMLTSDLHDAIMLEAQQALAYLPAEDKVNLALAMVAAPKIDDKNTVTQMAIDLKKKLAEAETMIAALQGGGEHATGTDQ